MRLWHKDLISCLPRLQLIGQWRECCLIAKNIAEKGTPNHLLVNKITLYPIEHFYCYASEVNDEMKSRGYKCDFSKFTKYIKIDNCHIAHVELFESWHNYRYLLQCFYNLQEKYDNYGIPEEEWNRFFNKFNMIYVKWITN